jgi:large subunit ribosomal protein L1
MHRGKKYRAISEKIDRTKTYPVDEAVKLVKENKVAKFDESVEVHTKLSIDTKKGEEQVRGTVVLPHGTGKTKKVAVITSTKAKEAKDAGADLVAGEDLIAKIKSGKIDFDILVATPEMMPKIAPVAKILGPKGLMPSPKTETVTEKIKETVEALKKGKVNFKNDDSGNIHQVIGKVSFSEENLKENFAAFMEALKKAKPAAVKGKFITSVTICSTMGPGIKVTS